VIIASTLQDCATAAGVLRIALDEEVEHAAREHVALAPEVIDHPEPRLATNGATAAVQAGLAGNGASVNGHHDPVFRNGVAGAPLNMAEEGLNLTEREE
jgi:hypothetical protein